MRKKSGFTIVEQAIVLIPEFEKVVRKLEQQVTLRGQSKSTLNNYIRRIALFVVHFGKQHYHLVFTVPHHLNAICLHNQRRYYDLLFSAVWNTLHSFGYTHFGVETGAVAVIHSWGQNLSLHPHIHCLVPAAGYTLDGKWKNIGHSGNYLYPVLQLSTALKESSSTASNGL
jgi:hypothetical protein